MAERDGIDLPQFSEKLQQNVIIIILDTHTGHRPDSEHQTLFAEICLCLRLPLPSVV